MARANFTGFRDGIETSIAVAPVTGWEEVQVNTPAKAGAELTRQSRKPMSEDRQRLPGKVTDQDSGFGFAADVIMSHLERYIPTFMYSALVGSGTRSVRRYVPTSVVASGLATNTLTPAVPFADTETVTIDATVYTFRTAPVGDYDVDLSAGVLADQLTALTAAINTGDGAHTAFGATTSPTVLTILARLGFGGTAYNGLTLATDVGAWDNATTTGGTDGHFVVAADGNLAENELVYARNWTSEHNDGLFLVGSGAIAAELECKAPLVADAAPAGTAIVEVAGVQGATGDLEIDVDGNLISTVLDFTTLGITVGQMFSIGGGPTGLAAGRFDTEADNDWVRADIIAANKITLGRKSNTFVLDAGTGKTIRLFYSGFCRSVSASHGDFLRQSHTMEVAYDSMAPGPAAHYEYSRGNFGDELKLNFPLDGKVTMDATFMGTDTEPLTTSRDTGPSTAGAPEKTEMFSSRSEMPRLRLDDLDETGWTSDVENVSLTIKNGVTPQKRLGQLGAFDMPEGFHEVDLELGMYLTDARVAQAIRLDTPVAFDLIQRNGDGAFAIDVPQARLGGGGKAFPTGELVKLTTSVAASKDPVLGYTLGISFFAHVPA